MTTTTTTAPTDTTAAPPPETPAATEKKTTTKKEPKNNDVFDKMIAEATKNQEALEVKLSDFFLGKNVRSELGDIEELVASIQAAGRILEPVIYTITKENADKKTLIAGFRRYAAAKRLKLDTIPGLYVTADAVQRLQYALIENIAREAMNPMDKATGMQQLMEQKGCDQKTLAKLLGLSEGAVSQHLALLKLPKKVQHAIETGKIEMNHARQLFRIKDEETCVEFLSKTIHEKWSSTELQAKVDFYVQREKEKAEAAAKKEKDATKATPKKESAKSRSDEEREEEDKKPTLADKYAEAKIEPLSKTDLRETLQFYGNKLDRAESAEKQAEYKGILKGLEIASGLKEAK